MKKLCPDLVGLSDQQLTAFWQAHRPEDLTGLADRLLAESLPRFPPRPPEFYPENLAELRGRELEPMAAYLGVNPSVLQAWESGEVRPPASLALIYRGRPET